MCIFTHFQLGLMSSNQISAKAANNQHEICSRSDLTIGQLMLFLIYCFREIKVRFGTEGDTMMEYMRTRIGFLIYLFIVYLPFMPVWVYLIALILLAIIFARYWKRRALRAVCIVIGLLIVIPLLGLRMYGPNSGRGRLKTHFGSVIASSSVVHHRFVWAGFGDTCDFWKLRSIDASNRQQIIEKFNLEPTRDESPFSLMNPPSWWPKSTGPYSVFDADDRYGDRIELWVPKEGSSVYLFKFSE